MEMNFCRRCGARLQHTHATVYTCTNDHMIFVNPAPAVGVVLYNDKGQVMLVRRALDPGKGTLDTPGGFCDDDESAEAALQRELQEELGLPAEGYDQLRYLISGLDDYEYAGETGKVLGIIFTAHLKPGFELHPADDVAGFEWFDVQSIPLDQIHFEVIKKVVRAVQQSPPVTFAS